MKQDVGRELLRTWIYNLQLNIIQGKRVEAKDMKLEVSKVEVVVFSKVVENITGLKKVLESILYPYNKTYKNARTYT